MRKGTSISIRKNARFVRNAFCLFICPARVYTLNKDGEVVLELDGCLECGTCRLPVPNWNGITRAAATASNTSAARTLKWEDMDIIVCLKQNVDMKQIRIKRDTREAVLEGLPLLFGDMDKNALEEAVPPQGKSGQRKSDCPRVGLY